MAAKAIIGLKLFTHMVQWVEAAEVFSALVTFDLFFGFQIHPLKCLGAKFLGFPCFSFGRGQMNGFMLQGDAKGSQLKLPP
jgi:hypothetical protein